MSKKINTKAINATVNTEEMRINENGVFGSSLKEYFEKYPNASLRKLAIATETTYGLLLKKSKLPIAGEIFDPDATNWQAVEEYLRKKEIDWTSLDWKALNTTATRGGAVVKDVSKFNVGDKVYLRKNATVPYEILYKTDTHIVIMLEGSSEPQAWSNNTFLLHGPQFEPRAEKATADA